MSDTNCGRGMYYDTPEEKEIATLTRQLDEARKREAALVEQLKDAVTWCPDCGGQGWYPQMNGDGEEVEQCQCERCHGQQAVIAGATCDFIPREIAERLAWALEAYAMCEDGCTCGDGWGHSTARDALTEYRKAVK
jgi:hypothetical protein